MNAQDLTIDIIKNNDALYKFCIRITNLSSIFSNESIRYLYLVSLISSDQLVDTETCKKAIDDISFIINNIDLFDVDDNIRKEVLKYANKGLKIAKRDYKLFLQSEKENK